MLFKTLVLPLVFQCISAYDTISFYPSSRDGNVIQLAELRFFDASGEVLMPEDVDDDDCDNPSGEEASMAADLDPNTKWLTRTPTTLNYHFPDGFLQEGMILSSYNVMTANDNADRDPRAWTIYYNGMVIASHTLEEFQYPERLSWISSTAFSFDGGYELANPPSGLDVSYGSTTTREEGSTPTTEPGFFDLRIQLSLSSYGSEVQLRVTSSPTSGDSQVLVDQDGFDNNGDYEFEFVGVDSQSTYLIEYIDSYGDGWHGGSIYVYVDESLVFSENPTGYGGSVSISTSCSDHSNSCIHPYRAYLTMTELLMIIVPSIFFVMWIGMYICCTRKQVTRRKPGAPVPAPPAPPQPVYNKSSPAPAPAPQILAQPYYPAQAVPANGAVPMKELAQPYYPGQAVPANGAVPYYPGQAVPANGAVAAQPYYPGQAGPAMKELDDPKPSAPAYQPEVAGAVAMAPPAYYEAVSGASTGGGAGFA